MSHLLAFPLARMRPLLLAIPSAKVAAPPAIGPLNRPGTTNPNGICSARFIASQPYASRPTKGRVAADRALGHRQRYEGPAQRRSSGRHGGRFSWPVQSNLSIVPQMAVGLTRAQGRLAAIGQEEAGRTPPTTRERVDALAEPFFHHTWEETTNVEQ